MFVYRVLDKKAYLVIIRENSAPVKKIPNSADIQSKILVLYLLKTSD